MNFLETHCNFFPLTENLLQTCNSFVCDNSDLNDFFNTDCIHYSQELLGKTYCFILESDPKIIVCAFTIANDSIKMQHMPGSRKRKITEELPWEKRHLKSFPSVLIGRLGVNIAFANKGIGSELMNFIKAWFVDNENKTGCRFIVVDSYNEDAPIQYYIKNGFKFLFSTENQEKEYFTITTPEPLKTRLMYFDLIVLRM